MKLFLLSSIDERHENRIPEGVFSSLENLYEWIFMNSNVSFTESKEIEGDFETIEIVVYFKETDEENEHGKYYIVESFYLDKKNMS